MSTLPSAPLPSTCAGAAAVTGNTAIGERTSVSPDVQVRKPVVHCSTSAVVLVKVTVNDLVSPGPANVSVLGSTTTSMPGTSAAAVNVPACVDVTERVTV